MNLLHFPWAAALFASTALAASPELLTRAIPAPLGSPASGHSSGPIFSPDGGFLLFSSSANDLMNAPVNAYFDVFMRNMTNGVVRDVSLYASATSANGDSIAGGISRNNRYLVFQSWANNLTSGDTNSFADVYLQDLATGGNFIVSRGTDSANASSGYPQVSDDGAWVAFQSSASNLGVLDTNGVPDIYAWRRSDRLIRLVSGNAIGLSRDVAVKEFFLMPDNVVLFRAEGLNLVTGAAGTSGQVYRRVLTNNALVWVSATLTNISGYTNVSTLEVAPSGDGKFALITARPAPGALPGLIRLNLADNTTALITNNVPTPYNGLTTASISSNGQYVAYASGTTVYRWNAATAQSQVADPGGAASGSAYSEMPRISPDGNLVAFVSNKTNLVAGLPSSGLPRLYVRDFNAGVTYLISAGPTGETTTSRNFGSVAFAPNNASLVFESAARELSASDANDFNDIFLWTKATAKSTLISSNNYRAKSVLSAGFSWASSASAHGHLAAFRSLGVMNPSDTNYNIDSYVYDRFLKTNVLVSRRTNGFAPATGVSKGGFLSPDGKLVAFETTAIGLAGSADTRTGNIHVFNLETLAMSPLLPASLSGSYAALRFAGDQLFADEGFSGKQYRFDTLAGTNRVFAGSNSVTLSVSSNGQVATFYFENSGQGYVYDFSSGASNRLGFPGYVSADGVTVAYYTTFGSSALVVSNRLTKTNQAFIVAPQDIAMSVNGRIIAYVKRRSAQSEPLNVYYVDTLTGKTNLVSRRAGTASEQGNDHSFNPTVSADGRFIAFESVATDLVAADLNMAVGSSRVDLQACKLEYSIVSPK